MACSWHKYRVRSPCWVWILAAVSTPEYSIRSTWNLDWEFCRHNAPGKRALHECWRCRSTTISPSLIPAATSPETLSLTRVREAFQFLDRQGIINSGLVRGPEDGKAAAEVDAVIDEAAVAYNLHQLLATADLQVGAAACLDCSAGVRPGDPRCNRLQTRFSHAWPDILEAVPFPLRRQLRRSL